MKILYIILLISCPLYSQEQIFDFFGLQLGMIPEELLTIVQESDNLIASEDVLLKQLKLPNPFSLKIQGNKQNFSLINYIYIDFYDQKSYQITIFLDPDYFSFYTLSEKLLDKYGVDSYRSSEKVIWYLQDSRYQLTLEKKSIIKFSDLSVLKKVVNFNSSELNNSDRNSFEINKILEEL